MTELISLLTFPGIVFHEFGHSLFCSLAGVKVRKVVYFQFGNPAGYVIHDAPDSFIKSLIITLGPLISGTLFSILFFTVSKSVPVYTYKLLLAWLGFSVATNCFPSSGDAKNLWQETNRHIWHNLLAIIGYPFALLIWLADFLRIVWFDFFYAVALYLLT